MVSLSLGGPKNACYTPLLWNIILHPPPAHSWPQYRSMAKDCMLAFHMATTSATAQVIPKSLTSKLALLCTSKSLIFI